VLHDTEHTSYRYRVVDAGCLETMSTTTPPLEAALIVGATPAASERGDLLRPTLYRTSTSRGPRSTRHRSSERSVDATVPGRMFPPRPRLSRRRRLTRWARPPSRHA